MRGQWQGEGVPSVLMMYTAWHLEAIWVLEAVTQCGMGVIAVDQLSATAANLDCHRYRIAIASRARGPRRPRRAPYGGGRSAEVEQA